MHQQELELSSNDGVTQLRGVLELPDGAGANLGAMLMVPGGWFAERDGFMGDSYTEADLMFRRIAHRVVNKGFAVVRYDNRGVLGNELTAGITKDSTDPVGDTEHYLSACIDQHVRGTVTPESLVEDVATFYDFMTQHQSIDSAKTIVFAHSEGGLHVARLIDDRHFAAKGIVLANTITTSPLEAMKWQLVDRYVAEVLSWDRNGDGCVDAEDVALGYSTSYFPDVGLSEADLKPEGCSWTYSQLHAHFTSKYEKGRDETLAIEDSVPFPLDGGGGLGFVAASHRWMKQWYLDDRSVLSLLSKYTGEIAFHFGGSDRQMSTQNEINHIREVAPQMASAPRFVEHKTRGHAFSSSKPVAGPMDEEAEEILVDEIVSVLEAG